MPELPEVELTRRGLIPELVGKKVCAVIIRQSRLRYPVPGDLPARLAGQYLKRIDRRGKYLLFRFASGTLIIHLGMSGSLRTVAGQAAAQKHDHLDIAFDDSILRLRDPRRFGTVLWSSTDVAQHFLIEPLGIEPLSAAFTGTWLHGATRGRTGRIKSLLMDSHIIVGVGNIYASESLFRARVDPRTPAGRLSRNRCERIVQSVRATLEDALAAGGSTLRDFTHSDGSAGRFQQQHLVYGRAGEPCHVCARPVQSLRMGQRSTFYCAHCQR